MRERMVCRRPVDRVLRTRGSSMVKRLMSRIQDGSSESVRIPMARRDFRIWRWLGDSNRAQSWTVAEDPASSRFQPAETRSFTSYTVRLKSGGREAQAAARQESRPVKRASFVTLSCSPAACGVHLSACDAPASLKTDDAGELRRERAKRRHGDKYDEQDCHGG